jgi:hypothetical protein
MISPYLSMTAFTFAMSGGPPAFTTAAMTLPRDRGCECYERAGVAGIKVVEAVHGAAWYEQGVARVQSMRHPVERDCQRPAETIPNFFKIAMIMRRRYLGLFRHSHVEHRQLAAIFSVVNQELQPQRTYPHFVRHRHTLLAKSIFRNFANFSRLSKTRTASLTPASPALAIARQSERLT